MHREIALKAPINDLMALQVFGGSTAAKGDILCGLTVIVPCDHTHPSTVAVVGQMKVFGADKVKLFS